MPPPSYGQAPQPLGGKHFFADKYAHVFNDANRDYAPSFQADKYFNALGPNNQQDRFSQAMSQQNSLQYGSYGGMPLLGDGPRSTLDSGRRHADRNEGRLRDGAMQQMQQSPLTGVSVGQPNKPPIPPRLSNPSAHQYGALGGDLQRLNRPPRAPQAPVASSLQMPGSSGSRVGNNRSSFGGMFELSNKIDRLGSGQRQYPSSNYGPPASDYRAQNHSLGPPARSQQVLPPLNSYNAAPSGGLASQNLLIQRDRGLNLGSYPPNQYSSPGGLSSSKLPSANKIR